MNGDVFTPFVSKFRRPETTDGNLCVITNYHLPEKPLNDSKVFLENQLTNQK